MVRSQSISEARSFSGAQKLHGERKDVVRPEEKSEIKDGAVST